MIRVAAASALIAAIFFRFARPGLGYYFTADDVMNLRRAWPEPVWHFARDCFTFSPVAYRPFGLLEYRAIFALVGFHPLPFHLISFGFLSFNLVLLAWLARRLTGSIKIGLLAALIGCFHSRMDYLYLNTGTIYDVICFTLYVGGLVWYMRIRQSGKLPDAWQTAFLLPMYLGALNSKEIAATWPVMLLAYELLYHGRVQVRRSWIIWLSSLLTAVFLARKLSSASVLVQGYKPRYSFGTLLQNWEAYTSGLFYGEGQVRAGVVFVLWLALLVTALVLRSKALQFSWVFLFLTPLPVSFIETRGLYVWYVPLAGWAVYLATVIALASRPVRAVPAQAAVFVACAVLLSLAHFHDRPNRFRPNDGKNDQVRDFERQIATLHPTLPKGAHILLLDDPFETNEWTPSSLMQLHYHDSTLEVQRFKQTADRSAIAASRHDFVFTYRNGAMQEVH
ncbi:MAG: hypothetical protein ACR2NN_05645 [Bryobacteraceae bacterium]